MTTPLHSFAPVNTTQLRVPDINLISCNSMNQFQSYLQTLNLNTHDDAVIDIPEFRKLCFLGIPDFPGIRQQCWKILLDYLPADKRNWQSAMSTQRQNYHSFIRDLILEAGLPEESELLDHDLDNPFNAIQNSRFLTFQRDSSMLEQIEKDVRRTLSTVDFFKQSVEPSSHSPLTAAPLGIPCSIPSSSSPFNSPVTSSGGKVQHHRSESAFSNTTTVTTTNRFTPKHRTPEDYGSPLIVPHLRGSAYTSFAASEYDPDEDDEEDDKQTAFGPGSIRRRASSTSELADFRPQSRQDSYSSSFSSSESVESKSKPLFSLPFKIFAAIEEKLSGQPDATTSTRKNLSVNVEKSKVVPQRKSSLSPLSTKHSFQSADSDSCPPSPVAPKANYRKNLAPQETPKRTMSPQPASRSGRFSRCSSRSSVSSFCGKSYLGVDDGKSIHGRSSSPMTPKRVSSLNLPFPLPTSYVTLNNQRQLRKRLLERVQHYKEGFQYDRKSVQIRPDYHWEVLERLLFLYAKLNPGVGYVQGMNEILAPLYWVFANDIDPVSRANAEADTFFCFTKIMSVMRDNFIKSMDCDSNSGIHAMLKRFDFLLRKRDYELWQNLESKTLSPAFYAFRWITVLFTQDWSLPNIVRLWDSLFSDPPFGIAGDHYLEQQDQKFRFVLDFCCSMVTGVRERLLKSNFEQSLLILQNYPIKNVDIILEHAYTFRLEEENRANNYLNYPVFLDSDQISINSFISSFSMQSSLSFRSAASQQTSSTLVVPSSTISANTKSLTPPLPSPAPAPAPASANVETSSLKLLPGTTSCHLEMSSPVRFSLMIQGGKEDM